MKSTKRTNSDNKLQQHSSHDLHSFNKHQQILLKWFQIPLLIIWYLWAMICRSKKTTWAHNLDTDNLKMSREGKELERSRWAGLMTQLKMTELMNSPNIRLVEVIRILDMVVSHIIMMVIKVMGWIPGIRGCEGHAQLWARRLRQSISETTYITIILQDMVGMMRSEGRTSIYTERMMVTHRMLMVIKDKGLIPGVDKT